MWHKTVGIVLHTLKYSDTSNIVVIYTRYNGRASFIVPISRSRKSALKNVLFQPLSIIEFEADFKPTTTLYKIKEAKSFYPFDTIPYDPYKSAIALFLAEFLYRSLREESENDELFSYLEHSIHWLDSCKTKYANFHLVFLIRFSRFLGLYPNIDDYAEGAYFDLQGAIFTFNQPTHQSFVNPEEASRINKLTRMNYDTMHLFEMNRTARNRCLTIINEYYSLHLPDFPKLKSLDILQELFS